MQSFSRFALVAFGLILALALGACSSDGEGEKTFYIGGIPDQDVSVLEARFQGLAEYLTDETGIKIAYVPSVDYAAVVTAMKQGDIQMAWFGGLTGVQARLAAADAEAIAQRPRDEEFHSVFVADPALGVRSLADLRGKSLTFGSESSTSGHLMPRYFLLEAGITPEDHFRGGASYSGSHDATWKLVESGAFDAGALNEAVWEQRVAAGEVDRTKVDVFFRTPPYYDYHWVVRGDVDEQFGSGAKEKIKQALLGLNAADNDREKKIAEAFQTDRFIATTNDNYKAIEEVAIQLGIVQP